MGGAAVCLLTRNPTRRTQDIDLVIHVDQRQITANQLSPPLLTTFPSDFSPVNQFGHITPAYRFHVPGGEEQLVQLEIFDYQSWSHRPQYDLRTASRCTLTVNGYPVKVFSPEWVLREKILSQHQRTGIKALSDYGDVSSLIIFSATGKPELDFTYNEELRAALADLLKKRPELQQALKRKIKCPGLFDNW
ncbi:uncharacterized protein N7500_000501 [Penicillium coprophilum]|uniref:uncharacterized protein n=1 Tax=Penicillium coprophilum TaxID=36646 RepID=UPI0023882A36|nr:uncharacterized protein N7500_000501 [Penicillium coprophilum]KAJ5177802.1 hypothetical protein N7500_000501 [Penicillium coprophilum]